MEGGVDQAFVVDRYNVVLAYYCRALDYLRSWQGLLVD